MVSNDELHDMLALDPPEALDIDIGLVAQAHYTDSQTYEQKYHAFSRLYAHAKGLRLIADTCSIHQTEQSWNHLTNSSEYAKILSYMTADYISQEARIHRDSPIHGIDWTHYARVIQGDGIWFLRQSIYQTGLTLQGLEVGLSITDAREFASLHVQLQKAIADENYVSASKLRDSINTLTDNSITTIYSSSNE